MRGWGFGMRARCSPPSVGQCLPVATPTLAPGLNGHTLRSEDFEMGSFKTQSGRTLG